MDYAQQYYDSEQLSLENTQLVQSAEEMAIWTNTEIQLIDFLGFKPNEIHAKEYKTMANYYGVKEISSEIESKINQLVFQHIYHLQ